MRVGPTLDKIAAEYPQDVRIVYMQHPLPMHAQAMLAAEAAMGAHAQGKFSAMNAKLLTNSKALSREKVLEIAKEIGLDLARFTRELDDHAHQPEIERQVKEVMAIGATGTPASFVNGRYLSGAKPFEAFKQVIDEELAWAKQGNRPKFAVGKNVREATPARPAAAAANKPDPNKIYDLPVGGAPMKGSPAAKVRILHYLDYQ